MAKDYIASKLVELGKLAKKTGLGKFFAAGGMNEEARWAWLAKNYDAYEKYDGCCAVITLFKPGAAPENYVAQSRTGEAFTTAGPQCGQMWKDLRDYGVFDCLGSMVVIAEAWWPGKGQFNEISGSFRRTHGHEPRFHLKVTDVFTLEEYKSGKTSVPQRVRMGRLGDVQPSSSWSLAVRYKRGSYGDPRDLCKRLVARGGYDGAVLVDPLAGWVLDFGKNGEKLKVKQKLSFDLRVTEVKTGVGEKTGRPVYTLVVSFNGKPLGVGSGVPHDLCNVPKVGDIVEVEAMEYSADGLLREPRFKGIRHDKLEPDA